MILIFDLDDTLYEEKTFVYSGFHAVAKYINQKHGYDHDESFNFMKNALKKYGRGRVFDELLKSKNLYSKKYVRDCVSIYRLHKPNIKLSKEASEVLKIWQGNIYLVTDGNKLVQKNKVNALSLSKYFKKIFITHCYGLQYSKPSPHCFEIIKKLENCKWEDLIYVGDNPAKDFVTLNQNGATTIRVLTGEYCLVHASDTYDAKFKINNLSELLPLMNRLLKKKGGKKN